MRDRKKLVLAAVVTLVVIVWAWIAPISTAGHVNCQNCEFVFVPDPDGGPSMKYAVCIDFDDTRGWRDCIPYQTTCLLIFQCYDAWG